MAIRVDAARMIGDIDGLYLGDYHETERRIEQQVCYRGRVFQIEAEVERLTASYIVTEMTSQGYIVRLPRTHAEWKSSTFIPCCVLEIVSYLNGEESA